MCARRSVPNFKIYLSRPITVSISSIRPDPNGQHISLGIELTGRPWRMDEDIKNLTRLKSTYSDSLRVKKKKIQLFIWQTVGSTISRALPHLPNTVEQTRLHSRQLLEARGSDALRSRPPPSPLSCIGFTRSSAVSRCALAEPLSCGATLESVVELLRQCPSCTTSGLRAVSGGHAHFPHFLEKKGGREGGRGRQDI